MEHLTAVDPVLPDLVCACTPSSIDSPTPLGVSASNLDCREVKAMTPELDPVSAIQVIPESQKSGIAFKIRMQVRIDQHVGIGKAGPGGDAGERAVRQEAPHYILPSGF
jgi:hypothetical protein